MKSGHRKNNRMMSTSLKPPRCGQPLFSPFHWRSPLSERKKDGTYRRTSSHSLFRKRERQIRQRRKRHGRYLAFRFHRQAAGIFRDSFLLDRLPQRISLRLKKYSFFSQGILEYVILNRFAWEMHLPLSDES